MEIVWILFQVFIGYNLVQPLLFYAFSKGQNQNQPFKLTNIDFDYAIIVTAYQETSFLPAVIDSILKLNYQNFLVYVVADNCDTTSLQFLDSRVIILHPEEILANNVKSHLHAIQHFKRPHDLLTIIDSDNLVHADYLNELNVFFNQGFKAVQGLRKPKSLTTRIARLDAVRDVFYHFYDGEILFKLGSSATLAGSGMAFKVNLYTSCLTELKIDGAGFDKALQAQIVKRNTRIAYATRAIVYDEKTKNTKQLVLQRSRWLNSWFKYFSLGFGLILRGIKSKSINQVLFGSILLRPPLFIFLSFSILILLLNSWLSPFAALFWWLAIGLFIISFYIALRKHKAEASLYKALWGIPKFVFYQFWSLLYLRNANKRSVATKHQVDA